MTVSEFAVVTPAQQYELDSQVHADFCECGRTGTDCARTVLLPHVAGIETALRLSDPDTGESWTRWICVLEWRYFAEALDDLLAHRLQTVLSAVTRNPSLADHTLSDGSRVGAHVRHGLHHDGWLTMLTLGSKQYRRDGWKRDQSVENARLAAAAVLHGALFGSIADCAACMAAKAVTFDRVQPYEVRECERIAGAAATEVRTPC